VGLLQRLFKQVVTHFGALVAAAVIEPIDVGLLAKYVRINVAVGSGASNDEAFWLLCVLLGPVLKFSDAF
jgi:hypothetical protein